MVEASDTAAGAAVVAWSVFADEDGVCANATLASSTEPARPAMVYLANISVSPSVQKTCWENPPLQQVFHRFNREQLERNMLGMHAGDASQICDQKPPQ
jgi:hypothetical protein